ncbi:MAG: response regulator [Burkholderiales bacterium]
MTDNASTQRQILLHAAAIAAPLAVVLAHQALLDHGSVPRVELALAFVASLGVYVHFARTTMHRLLPRSAPDSPPLPTLPDECLDVTPAGAPWSTPLMAALARGRSARAREPETPLTPVPEFPPLTAIDSLDVTYHASVLLASGDDAMRQRLSSLLTVLGCEVETADSEATVVRAFAGRRFDLVILDCDSADVEGFEAARAIRDDEARCFAHPPVPLIGLMRGADVVDPERRLSVGMSELVNRLSEHHQVADLLRRWLPARLRGVDDGGAALSGPPQPSHSALARASSW